MLPEKMLQTQFNSYHKVSQTLSLVILVVVVVVIVSILPSELAAQRTFPSPYVQADLLPRRHYNPRMNVS